MPSIKRSVAAVAVSILSVTCCLLALAGMAGCIPLGGCTANIVPPTLFSLRGGPPLEVSASGLPGSEAAALAQAVALPATGELAYHQSSCWSETDNMRLSTRRINLRIEQYSYADPAPAATRPGQLVAAGDDSRLELDPLPDTAGATNLRLSGRFSLARAQRGLFELAPGEATVFSPPAGGYTLLRVDWTLTGATAAGPLTVNYAQAMQWRSSHQALDSTTLADLSMLPPYK